MFKPTERDLLDQYLQARGRKVPPGNMNSFQLIEFMCREILLLHAKVEQLERQSQPQVSDNAHTVHENAVAQLPKQHQ